MTITDVETDSEKNVYVSGFTPERMSDDGTASAYSAVVVKYSRRGDKLWTKHCAFGPETRADGLVIHDGHIYVWGKSTFKNTGQEASLRGFIAKFDVDGRIELNGFRRRRGLPTSMSTRVGFTRSARQMQLKTQTWHHEAVSSRSGPKTASDSGSNSSELKKTTAAYQSRSVMESLAYSGGWPFTQLLPAYLQQSLIKWAILSGPLRRPT